MDKRGSTRFIHPKLIVGLCKFHRFGPIRNFLKTKVAGPGTSPSGQAIGVLPTFSRPVGAVSKHYHGFTGYILCAFATSAFIGGAPVTVFHKVAAKSVFGNELS